MRYITVCACFILWFSPTLVSLTIDSLEKCYQEKTEKKRWKTKIDSPFHFHYGEPAVEIFHLLTDDDINRINVLVKCIADADPTYFLIDDIGTDEDTSVERILEAPGSQIGRGNVTFMNGAIQHFLPGLIEQITARIQPVLDELHWKLYGYELNELGVRSVRFLSNRSPEKMKSKAEIDEKQRKFEEDRNKFVVNPNRQRSPKDDSKVDKLSDTYVSQFMRHDEGLLYTLVIQMNSRENYHGGEFVVRKFADDNEHGIMESDVSEEDEYDADVDHEGNDISEEHVSHRESDHEYRQKSRRLRKVMTLEEYEKDGKEDTKAYNPNVYNALLSRIGRHTPEKSGGVLLISEYPHGVLPIVRGLCNRLIIEFWAFADSELSQGPVRPTVDEAKPLLQNTDRLDL